MLPAHVLECLGVNEGDHLDRVLGAINRLELPFGDVLLSEDGTRYLSKVAQSAEAISAAVTVSPCNEEFSSWRVATLAIDSQSILEVVCFPREISSKDVPTKIQELLIDAWLTKTDVFVRRDDRQGPTISQGKALLFWQDGHNNCGESSKQAILSIASALLGFNDHPGEPQYSPTWADKTTFDLVPRDMQRKTMPMLLKLFGEAARETKIKWKFLGLYRILEFGYLSNVLEGIQRDFLADPTMAVGDATEALKNEFNQFRNLSQQCNLDNYFEALADEFKELVASNNKFACALERRLGKDQRLKNHPGPAAKGVLVTYSIRCAIVHAGEGSLLFDSYFDAKSGLNCLIKHLECAVLSYLGIRPQEISAVV